MSILVMTDDDFEKNMQRLADQFHPVLAASFRARDTAQREALAEAVGLLREVNSQRFTTPATVEIIESFIGRHSQTFHDHAQAKNQEAQGAQAGDGYFASPEEYAEQRAALATQPAAGEPVATLRLIRSLGGPSVKVLRFDADQLPHGALVDVFAAPPAAAHGDGAVRKDAEVAIKQGRYLASAAEDYINAIHDAFDLEETNLHREVVGDSNRRLSSAIYEFRRSAYRAMHAQGDGEVQ